MAPILLLLHSFLIFIHFNALILMLPPIHKDYLDHYKHNYNHIINYYNHQFGRHSCRSHNFNTNLNHLETHIITDVNSINDLEILEDEIIIDAIKGEINVSLTGVSATASLPNVTWGYQTWGEDGYGGVKLNFFSEIHSDCWK